MMEVSRLHAITYHSYVLMYGLIRYNFTECVMQCRGSDLSNCIRADVIRDMLNVVEFGRHDSRPIPRASMSMRHRR